METVAPHRQKRRGCRWLFLTAGILAALPFLAFALSNLLLASSWGRGKIERKIQAISGLETHIDGASWSPWNGASLYSVRLLQPHPLRPYVKEPMIAARRVKVMPVWKAWLSGQRQMDSIELDSLRMVVPIEAVSASIRVPGKPHLPSQTQASSPIPDLSADSPPISEPTGTTQRGPNILIPPGSIPEIPEEISVPKLMGIPTSWLRMENASCLLFSARSGRTLAEVSHASGQIPISGDPALSRITVDHALLLGGSSPTPVDLSFSWQHPVLSLGRVEFSLGHQKMVIAAKVAKLPGIPMQWDIQLPEQPLAGFPLPMGAQAKADTFKFRGRFRGALLAPATWQGDFLAEVQNLHGTMAGREFSFDHGRALTLLRGNVLTCLDARLEGDELSLLGNATLLSDGRAAGVARFIATPESIQAITSHLFPRTNRPPVTTPLGTPQRVAFDLHTFGTLGNMYLQLGQDGPLVQMNPPAR